MSAIGDYYHGLPSRGETEIFFTERRPNFRCDICGLRFMGPARNKAMIHGIVVCGEACYRKMSRHDALALKL